MLQQLDWPVLPKSVGDIGVVTAFVRIQERRSLPASGRIALLVEHDHDPVTFTFMVGVMTIIFGMAAGYQIQNRGTEEEGGGA